MGRRRQERQRWSRPVIIAALRERARNGLAIYGDVNLYNTARRYFGTLEAAARAAKIDFRTPEKWSREKTIATLRALAVKHGVVTIALSKPSGVLHGARRNFGTLSAACDAAGISSWRQTQARKRATKDDPKTMLKELRQVARRLDHPVARRDLPWTLYEALRLHFGTLDAARRAARIKGPRRVSKWTPQTIICELREEHRKGTRITSAGLAKAKRFDLACVIGREFGTYERARRAAGIENEPLERTHVPFVKIWDEATVIAAIKTRNARREPLAYSKVPNRLRRAAHRYFGTWRDAIEAAGLDYDKIRLAARWDDDELFARMRKLAGEQPQMTITELQRTALGAALGHRFGTMTAAAEHAEIIGWPVRQAMKPMGPDEVRAILRARLQLRRGIARTEIKRDFPELWYSVTRVHPVWSVALRKLGFGGPTARSGSQARGA